MQYMPYSLVPATSQAEDDIDRLFARLPQVEPPGETVGRILRQIRRLPAPAVIRPPTWHIGKESLAGTELDSLIVRNEKREPS